MHPSIVLHRNKKAMNINKNLEDIYQILSLSQ